MINYLIYKYRVDDESVEEQTHQTNLNFAFANNENEVHNEELNNRRRIDK